MELKVALLPAAGGSIQKPQPLRATVPAPLHQPRLLRRHEAAHWGQRGRLRHFLQGCHTAHQKHVRNIFLWGLKSMDLTEIQVLSPNCSNFLQRWN